MQAGVALGDIRAVINVTSGDTSAASSGAGGPVTSQVGEGVIIPSPERRGSD